MTSLPPASATNLLVCGLARNCAASIEREVLRLSSALVGFKTVQWLIIESDSSDDTVRHLNSLGAKVPNFTALSLGHLKSGIPDRVARIAHCRNRYLDAIAAERMYEDVDMIAVADLDGVNSLLDSRAIESCWEQTDWEVCTANQRGPYYDLYALRHPDWCPSDCWRQVDFFLTQGLSHNKALLAGVRLKMITIAETAAWIPVQSAFGGFALYRRSALAGARYQTVNDAGENVCEHVTFHASLANGKARIFINPRLINTGVTEHSIDLRPWNLATAKYRRMLKRLLGINGPLP